MGINYEEALNIFREVGLPNDYNEQDLLKAYRELAKKYHPDYNIGNEEEAKQNMQRVNEARDVLKNNLGRTTGPNFDEMYKSIQFQNYKKDKLNLIDSYNIYYIENINFGKNNPDFDTLKKKMIDFSGKSKIHIRVTSTIQDCDIAFNNFKIKLKEYYIEFMHIYFSSYGIDYKKINTNIDYDLPLDKFYSSIIKIKAYYIDNLIDNILSKYKLYANYDKVIIEIGKYKEKIFQYLKDKNLTLESDYINNIDNGVLKIFKTYDENLKRYNALLEEIKNIDDKDILNLAEFIEEFLASEEIDGTFDEIYEKIAFKKEHEKNKEYMQKLYNIILDKAYLALGSLDSVKDSEQINNILELEKDTIDLFQKYELGEIKFDTLMKIKEVTFTNIIEDRRLINTIANNLDPDKISNLYITTNSNLPLLLKLIKENDEDYLVGGFSLSFEGNITKIPSKDNYYNLISLEEFMNNAEEFFVRCHSDVYGEITCLYRYNDDCLFLDINNRLIFGNNILISKIQFLENDEYAEYKDRDFVKNRIIEQFENELTKASVENNIKR